MSFEVSSFRAECNEVEKSLSIYLFIDLSPEHSGLRFSRDDELSKRAV
jgi:hypothetical protein